MGATRDHACHEPQRRRSVLPRAQVIPLCDQAHRRRCVVAADLQNVAEKRHLQNLRWSNPKPDRIVRAIELESDPPAGTAIFVVVLTAGLAE